MVEPKEAVEGIQRMMLAFVDNDVTAFDHELNILAGTYGDAASLLGTLARTASLPFRAQMPDRDRDDTLFTIDPVNAETGESAPPGHPARWASTLVAAAVNDDIDLLADLAFALVDDPAAIEGDLYWDTICALMPLAIRTISDTSWLRPPPMHTQN